MGKMKRKDQKKFSKDVKEKFNKWFIEALHPPATAATTEKKAAPKKNSEVAEEKPKTDGQTAAATEKKAAPKTDEQTPAAEKEPKTDDAVVVKKLKNKVAKNNKTIKKLEG